ADRLEASLRRRGAVSAREAVALWEEQNWLLGHIEELREAQQRGAGALLERVAFELEWLFAAPRRRAASVLASDELGEAQALAAGQRALAELAELARMRPQLAPRDAHELAGVLEQLQLVCGERPSPERVAVLDPLALRARRVRALFLCG